MNNASRYNYCVEPFTEDYCGNLSWGNLGNIILRCATLHATEHGFGYTQMREIHHAWVLSRLVIEMDTLPRTGDAYAVETWVDRLYRQFTDRHFSVLRPDGTPFGHATSIWSLIDTSTRRPADLSRLPNGGFSAALIPERHSPIAPMGRMKMKQPTLVARHTAAYSDLDINGHVNSVRYIELLLNHFSADEMKIRPVRRIEMAYCLESYQGDVLAIYYDTDIENPLRHLFEVRREADNEIVVKGTITF